MAASSKEVAISKRLKINEAQQYMILAVLGASIILGVAIALVMHFVQTITFNTNIIMAQEASIADYTKVIQSTGICKKPKGSTYTKEELDNCDPNSIEAEEVEGTLRYNILNELAANEALNSVPKENASDCQDSEGNSYTYEELEANYKKATTTEALTRASQAIKRCSALRVIPDALPSYRNSEALLASLNNIFNISSWEPESISPGESGGSEEVELVAGLNPIYVNLSVETDSATTMRVLSNIERSIREFDILSATIEWGGDDALVLQAQATAYYVDKATITEDSKVITAGQSSSTSTTTTEGTE